VRRILLSALGGFLCVAGSAAGPAVGEPSSDTAACDSYSATEDALWEREFLRAAGRQIFGVADMWGESVRGSKLIQRWYEEQRIPSAAGVRRYLRTVGARSPSQRVGLLFYDHQTQPSSPPELHSWLIAEQRAIHCRHAVSRSRLASVVGALRQALGVEELQVARSATRRGYEMPSPGASRPTLADSVREATRLLLPETFVDENVDTLIIVPTGELTTIPFAVLQPLPGGRHLIDRATLVVAPSLADLNRAGRPVTFEKALIVGNPTVPHNQEWIMPPLPGAEAEAIDIGRFLGTSPLIRAAATKTAVTGRARDADLLYLATHGVADPQDPNNGSFLALAGDRKAGWRWTLKDIQFTRFRARLAVLSACQTGLGQVQDAGILGIARAFQIAGVDRVVISLWNVDDAATHELMTSFMRSLTAGTRADRALRDGMRSTREKYPHPAHWASFVLFAGTP